MEQNSNISSLRLKGIIILCDLVGHCNGNNPLCLFQFVEKHGEPLYNIINDKYKERKVFFVYGGVNTDTREEIREIVENETDAIIVAVMGRLALVLTFGILITSCSQVPQKQKLECFSPWGVVCDLETKQKSQSL